MTITTTRGAIKKFRRTPWRFQQTVQRPDPGDLDRFVSTIIAAHGNLEAATVTIDEVVFDTVRMSELCTAGSVLAHDVSLTAHSSEEAQALLVAAFLDGPDFICVPTPKPFVFYADHHDWVTFYANTKSHLNQGIIPLEGQGYKMIQDWQREL
ncbi:MAG TPA: hypothetical protein VF773_01160 [Verrucomicrobiae bacterium]